jgi:asparagine synthase (glutamine-hydrolysing)
MCGIFGWALSSGKRQSGETLTRLTDLMIYRGPDGSGYYLDETANGNFQIGLGHRRLSIIDIDGGAQPMWSADGTIALIFNGEIYNYVELRRELKTAGHAFRTNSDTEVLIEAYRAWGLDAIPRFRGMFAFALWDIKRQRLILARDPFGKKPLFIAECPGSMIFGSEIEPIIQFPGFERRFDTDALGHYLLNRYVPGPSTFFRDLKKLQPGHYAIWQDGHLSLTRYYTAPFATTEPDILRFDDAVAMFSETFDDAVRIRMRSDAPFGAYLSGGLDSSAVVAAMMRHSSRAIRTFFVGFHEREYSELEHARTVAQQFKTDHHELIIEAKDFIAEWPEAVRRRGAPVSESSDIPILMLSKAASKSVKMVMTGEGSDELMAGYPKHRAERWMDLYQRMMPQVLHARLVAPTLRALPYGMRRVKIAATAAGERDLAIRMRVWFGGISVQERDVILGHAAPLAPPDLYPFSSRIGSNMRRTLFFDQTSYLPDNLLERNDRMMMAGSIEGRMPFMDTELAALVARFPDEFLIGRKGGKAVLRAAMDKILPSHILARKKLGFRVPFGEWFRGVHSDFVREILTSNASEVARICNRSAVRQFVDEHNCGKYNHEKILWSLANLELFLRTFKPSAVGDLYETAA